MKVAMDTKQEAKGDGEQYWAECCLAAGGRCLWERRRGYLNWWCWWENERGRENR